MSTSVSIDGQSGFEAILAGYASGTLPCALHALVGAHLELSGKNRAFVASLEEALGKKVVSQDCCGAIRDREARLDAIFCCGEEGSRKRDARCADPRALQHLIGGPIDALAFRKVVSGVQEFPVATGQGMQAKLFRIAPGKRIPRHSHEGMEVTLVLRGAFSDVTGHYRCGDVAYADEHIDHVPVAEEGQECVCFSVLDAPRRLTGPLGRLLNPFVRI